MKVKIKRIHPDAVVPKYATDGAAGFDLVAVEDIPLAPGETALVKTGLSVEIPKGFEMQVRPRSGTSLKTPVTIPNAPGTIDSDYRGEVCVIVRNSEPKGDPRFLTHWIKKGDRIAQGVICAVAQAQFEETTTLSDTIRGSGGFGSTGK